MIRTTLLAAVLLLGGCSTALKPLDYKAERAYVPMSVTMPPPASRFDQQKQQEVIQRLRETGAFSFLDGGFSKTGYSLLVDQSGGKGAGVLPAVFGALTLLTVPIPYTYERQLHGSLYKDGQLVKAYAYKRGGWTATTWYIPMTEPRSESEMLGELMRDLDRDRLIPYQ
ncbi:hypothetical protein EJJ20_18380 [Pseudomonas poae]|uniref:hypothetical protein n=1 Tax=Pseudomonas TaxID=286 RepID=UPI000BC37456|nr:MULTISPECIES: hypothetical protein [Pseudomonas]AZP71551.1 hypothetical protein EJJ20_18380 [Pseudomonas poae]OYU04646.1 MAG: hypothetical protein CFE47_25560 [Pseudomonas sp. PGPPP1]